MTKRSTTKNRKRNWRLFLLLLPFAVILTACPRIWDNPRDPDSPDYHGHRTVDDPNRMAAETPDDASLVFQTFTVDEVRGAQAYRLEISSAHDFLTGNILYSRDDLSSRFLGGRADLTTEENHYWRAAAKKNEVWGGWTAARSFRLGNNYGTLIPADISNTTPTFSWTAIDGAAKYELQLADSEAALSGATPVEVDTASYTLGTALTNETTYYWRVRAVNDDGYAALWSETRNFQADWGYLTGLSPADGASTSDTTPAFSWDAVDGAAKYELQLADSEAALSGATPIEVTTAQLYAWNGIDESDDLLLAGQGY